MKSLDGVSVAMLVSFVVSVSSMWIVLVNY